MYIRVKSNKSKQLIQYCCYLFFNEIEMFYNRNQMQVIKGNKVTFKTEDVIIALISQFFKIRVKICSLINEPPNRCFDPKQIFRIIKSLPKSLQRSKNRYNQLLLCQQLSTLVDYFISIKQKPSSVRKKSFGKLSLKHKPYQLVLIFRQLSQILINRIKSSVSGNIQEIANNKENFKLFYFINELQNFRVEIQNWAKNKDSKFMRTQHQSVEFIYPKSSTYRKTLATTTDASKNISKHEKNSIFDQFHQKASDAWGLRAHTANLKKRDVKLTTRCPSAASLLKNQTYKQPIFEAKKGILKYKHKSTDFQNKTCRNNFETHENNVNFQSIQNSRFREIKIIVSKERNISILNKTILKDQQDALKIKSSKKILIENDRLKKTGIALLGTRKKQINANILSSEQISSSKNVKDTQKIESQCQILDPEALSNKKSQNVSFKQMQVESCQNVESKSNEENSSIESSFWQTQENTVYIKQRQLYKKARRSGKVMIKDKEDFKDVYMINIPKKKQVNNFSRRRKAMLSTHNEDMTEIQKIANQQNQQKAQKQLQYDENVLLALSDALKSKKNIKQPKEFKKIPKRKHTFNSLFNEMNDFLKDYYIGRPSQQPESVFFEQQKRIRCFQDYNFRQKMKQIIKTNGIMNVFDITTAQFNNKDQIYNQIHRYFTFNSDSEWIKSMFTPKETLIQKSM